LETIQAAVCILQQEFLSIHKGLSALLNFRTVKVTKS
jgi:hypothetical protein